MNPKVPTKMSKVYHWFRYLALGVVSVIGRKKLLTYHVIAIATFVAFVAMSKDIFSRNTNDYRRKRKDNTTKQALFLPSMSWTRKTIFGTGS